MIFFHCRYLLIAVYNLGFSSPFIFFEFLKPKHKRKTFG